MPILIIPSDSKCFECPYLKNSYHEHDLIIKLWDMTMENYCKGLVSHLREATDKFLFSIGEKEGIKEGAEHIALKLYAYAHYATIRDYLKIPLDIKYEHFKGYYPFDLVVRELSHSPSLEKNIGIECITMQSYLKEPKIIYEKIAKAHYHLRMAEITRFELYLEPSFEIEQSTRNIINKIRLFGETITCRVPSYKYEDFLKTAQELRLRRNLL